MFLKWNFLNWNFRRLYQFFREKKNFYLLTIRPNSLVMKKLMNFFQNSSSTRKTSNWDFDESIEPYSFREVRQRKECSNKSIFQMIFFRCSRVSRKARKLKIKSKNCSFFYVSFNFLAKQNFFLFFWITQTWEKYKRFNIRDLFQFRQKNLSIWKNINISETLDICRNKPWFFWFSETNKCLEKQWKRCF